jgi:hypothetical protein
MSLEQALAKANTYSPHKKVLYTEIAEKYSIVRSTLTHQHKGICASPAIKNINQQQLTPQQEQELLEYIEKLNTHHLLLQEK